ncbi:MAG: carboxypeptidase regulatory-like domain-containing protein [Acidobacteria bacterium]|nr:carboxypeptidase regulatory-like domain-containing protein [Acidobacteriota bacterium]
MRNRSVSACLLLSLCAIFQSETALAQTATATISGSVRDETSAVLPGVSVTVRHLDTGASRAIVTDDSGRYHLPNLSLGSYEVQAELAGFQTSVRSGITLSVGQEAVLDFVMRVGEISEKVMVTGEAALVETTSSAVRATVNDKQIRDLPLNGRDFSQLATLQSGVYAPPAWGRPTQPHKDPAPGSLFPALAQTRTPFASTALMSKTTTTELLRVCPVPRWALKGCVNSWC